MVSIDENTEIQASNKVSIVLQVDDNSNKSMVVIEVPTVVQTDESQVFLGHVESPNKALYNILS